MSHDNKPKSDINFKEDLKIMIDHYLASNPFEKHRDKINEFEVRFNPNPRKGKKFSKMDYDATIVKLLACGFQCDNPTGITMLRIQTQTKTKYGETAFSNVRAEIVGAELVQQYCKINNIKKLIDSPINNDSKIKFTKKSPATDKSGRPIPRIFNNDNNFNISYNTETDYGVSSVEAKPIIDDWVNSKKTFRLLNRVHFTKPGCPIVADLSIIKKSATANDIMIPEYTIEESGLFSNPDHCEIELEIDNSMVGTGSQFDKSDAVIKQMQLVIRNILSGLQGTNYPVPYSEQEDVLQSYMRLLHKKKDSPYEPRKVLNRDFIGPSSITLHLKHISEIDENSKDSNIRNNYCVTDKADGERKMLYIDTKNGKMYLIDTNMFVQYTGCTVKDKTYWGTLIDGEHIKYDAAKKYINTYAAFDIYYIAEKSVRELNFMFNDHSLTPEQMIRHRLPLLQKVFAELKLDTSASDFKIKTKRFFVSDAETTIFNACSTILSDITDGVYLYNTDGLIFTPINTGVGGHAEGHTSALEKTTWSLSFKWKPPAFNTIDFMVKYKKDKNGKDEIHTQFEGGINFAANDARQHRTIMLLCGFNQKSHSYINPFQDMIEDIIPNPGDIDNEDTYKPVLFQPTQPYDQEACFANINLVHGLNMITEEGEVFEDNMIVEFYYDGNREAGWRWVPLRVRHDKTYELRSLTSKNYGNAYHVANDIWKTIHHPISEDVIKSGENIPDNDTNDDVYYNTMKNDEKSFTRGLRDFHNLYVKMKLIKGVAKRGDTLIDYAVGKAGDMSKWKYSNLKFIFGIDISKDNIYNQSDGACARYLNERKRTNRLFDAIYLPGNSGLNIRNGNAFFTDKERDIAKAILGNGPKDQTKMPRAVYKSYGIGSKGFNISSCQFALHYFFENSTSIHNFIRNLSECTQVNGYFIATCYDGQTVYNNLINKKKNEGFSIHVDDKKIFEIQKMYDQNGFFDDESSLGYSINVFQETINKYAVEYLVNFDYLCRIMENYGFKLVTNEEAKSFGFDRGSGMFSDLYSKMDKDVSQNPDSKKWYRDAMIMTEQEKQISFMNRYMIFKKTHSVNADKITKILEINDAESIKEMEKDVSEKEKEDFEKAAKEALKNAPLVKLNRGLKAKKRIILDKYSPIQDSEAEIQSEAVVFKEIEDEPEPKPEEKRAIVEDVVEEAPIDVDEKQEKDKCKKGTRKYAPLGNGCYTKDDIDKFKDNKTKKNLNK
jgi:hypothetical protein